MDFWSRLIGGGPPGKPASPKKVNPYERLERFRRTWNATQQACDRPQTLGNSGHAVDNLLSLLRQLVAILREELRSPAPYLCLSHAAEYQIYSAVARAATVCKDERIRQEAVTLFSIFMDSEVEGFVSNRSFARAFMRFSMRLLDSGGHRISSETESQLIEVLFGISAKLRLDPDILSVWFSPSTRAEIEEAVVSEKTNFVGLTQRDDFPLCYFFIDRVHHEGRVGDFARTGLLYIFEAASRSDTLDQWIVASDLPTLMASALGALYSQLSRELSLIRDTHDLPILLAMSDYAELKQEAEVETISSESFKLHMATFLSDLTFWQDILDHCRSADVKQTLLDHFQVLFLQQLLYPSLLQSSDTDGGSSVAVLTYLASILHTLTDDALTQMLLSYLMGTQPSGTTKDDSPPSPRVMRRRSSLLMTSSVTEDDLEPSLFNLADLIHNGLQSKNSQTAFAALKLFTVILTLQPSHAIGSLIRRSLNLTPLPARTVGALDTEARAYMRIAKSLGGSDGLAEAFDGISVDVRKKLDEIAFRQVQFGHTIDSRNNSAILSEIPRAVSKSMLDLNDTGIKALLRLIESFLSNSVETNLALTETMAAVCMSVRLDVSGLLAIRPDQYRLQGQSVDHNLNPAWLDDEEKSALASLMSVTQPPTLDASNTPALLSTLAVLEAQVSHLRESIDRFDALLSKRKSILQTPTHADALYSTPAKSRRKQFFSTPVNSISRQGSPGRTPRHMALAARNGSLTNTPTRNSSPGGSTHRGRRPSNPTLTPMAPNITLTPTQPSRSRNTSTMASPTRTPHNTTNRSPIRTPINAAHSPARTPLSATVFRPPPPEPQSPPRATPPSPAEDISLDAETLTLRVRFRHGKPPSFAQAVTNSQLPSRARSPFVAEGSVPASSRASSAGPRPSSSGEEADNAAEDAREVSLSHVLTNVVVLQNWVLELVAILQLRARVYEGEVRFC